MGVAEHVKKTVVTAEEQADIRIVHAVTAAGAGAVADRQRPGMRGIRQQPWASFQVVAIAVGIKAVQAPQPAQHGQLLLPGQAARRVQDGAQQRQARRRGIQWLHFRAPLHCQGEQLPGPGFVIARPRRPGQEARHLLSRTPAGDRAAIPAGDLAQLGVEREHIRARRVGPESEGIGQDLAVHRRDGCYRRIGQRRLGDSARCRKPFDPGCRDYRRQPPQFLDIPVPGNTGARLEQVEIHILQRAIAAGCPQGYCSGYQRGAQPGTTAGRRLRSGPVDIDIVRHQWRRQQQQAQCPIPARYQPPHHSPPPLLNVPSSPARPG